MEARRDITKKEAEAMAKDVKTIKDLEKLMIEQAYKLADGSQHSIALLVALAKSHKSRTQEPDAEMKKAPAPKVEMKKAEEPKEKKSYFKKSKKY